MLWRRQASNTDSPRMSSVQQGYTGCFERNSKYFRR
jgi:hypothetical protein